jgi:hypothetical protein
VTRQWLGVRPSELCNQHLLGEHAEHHQLLGTARNHDHGAAIVRGHVRAGDVNLSLVQDRHDALADELEARGRDHDSPLSVGDLSDMDVSHASVDRQGNRADLRQRCADCRRRMDDQSAGEVIA